MIPPPIQRGIPTQVVRKDGSVVGALLLDEPGVVIGIVEDERGVVLMLQGGRPLRALGTLQEWADSLKWTGGPMVTMAFHGEEP